MREPRKFLVVWIHFAVITVAAKGDGIDDERTSSEVLVSPSPAPERKACYGSDNGMSKTKFENGAIQRLRNMYTNCTIIHGNLEIVGITADDMQKEKETVLDMFENIEEVIGYVLIADNSLPFLSLPRLRIIWGDTLFSPQSHGSPAGELSGFSLFVIGNNLEYLDMHSLRAVAEGKVGVFSNRRLCHWTSDKIDWSEVIGKDHANRFVSNKNETIEFCKDPDTYACSASCRDSRCWATGDGFCQEIYRKNCGLQCRTRMCFNASDPLSCCSPECAAGCYGPKNDQCYGCRAMRDEGVCVDKCPSREVYDWRSTQYVKNPDGKFAWNRECVKICPEHMFVYKEGCVSRCPDGYYTEGDNDTECKSCAGLCPKACLIDKSLTSINWKDFVNCTVVEGFLEIREDTMEGGTEFINFKPVRYDRMTLDQLEVLSTVQRITQYLFVQSSKLKSLKFLRNLKKIDGRKKTVSGHALEISSSDQLTELGFHSLKQVMDGNVLISSNPKLCFADTINWTAIVAPQFTAKIIGNRADCREAGLKCDSVCKNSSGCWGRGPEMCGECLHYEFNGTCVNECYDAANLFAVGKTCEACHHECVGCKGPGAAHCKGCKHMELDNVCVESCPNGSHYKSGKQCLRCHANCDSHGCTGPSDFVGDGGCNSCRLAVVKDDGNVFCLSAAPPLNNSNKCRLYPNLTDYYYGPPPLQLQHLQLELVCMKCMDVCETCDSFGMEEQAPFNCRCKRHRAVDPKSGKGTCVAKCPANTYPKAAASGNLIDCYPCHSNCETCFGPDSTQCYACGLLVFRDFYLEGNDTQFNCTRICPSDRPYDSNNTCTAYDHKRSRRTLEVVIGVALGITFLFLMVACTAAFICWRRYRTTTYLEPDDKIEINPDAKPNLAQLRLIIETDLRRGSLLGSGAFGDVYKGIWCPATSNAKYPVAIKVLHKDKDKDKGSAAAQKEMLSEAAIMASMENPYLLPLIGVCVGSQLMLITPLVPLGNLLEYVQNNKAKIGSAILLRWCTQIASGMAYLEDKRLVHRDLAARNVLVKTPHHIRITDFGLAKMLDYGEDEVKSTGEKMPIKWLALECIQFRRYSHKSDVWAYAVTVWELLTFGDKPYRDVQLSQIQYLLEKGERLPQPKICSLDIYLIMVKCWMVNADTRPSFRELTEEFSRMTRDPGRYLVIEGDALLRLPIYTDDDQEQMLEQLGDEPGVYDADELFNNFSFLTTTPTSHFSGSGCILDSVEGTTHLREVVGQRCGQRQQSISGRYASDPLKNAGISFNAAKPDEVQLIRSPPTDTDNYLIPDQRSMIGAQDSYSTYTQLVDGQNDDDANAKDYYQHLKAAISGAVDGDAIELRSNRCLDNGVYTLQASDDPTSQSCHLPKVCDDLRRKNSSELIGLPTQLRMEENESAV